MEGRGPGRGDIYHIPLYPPSWRALEARFAGSVVPAGSPMGHPISYGIIALYFSHPIYGFRRGGVWGGEP